MLTKRSTPTLRPAPDSYAGRIARDRDAAGDYDILIDGELRFRVEREPIWPHFWYLFEVVDGKRQGASIASENEHWDLIGRLEQGEFWAVPRRAAAAIV